MNKVLLAILLSVSLTTVATEDYSGLTEKEVDAKFMERMKLSAVDTKPARVEYVLEGEVNDTTNHSLRLAIKDAESKNVDLFIRINSPGGEIMAELAMVSAIKQTKVKVITFIETIGASAAAMIFSAGDERILAPGSLLLFHYSTMMYMGPINNQSLKELTDQQESINTMIEDQLMDSLKVDRKCIQNRVLFRDRDNIMNSDDALNLGVATKVSADPLDTHPDEHRK